MGIKKMRLLACESMYWIGISSDIETHIKTVQHVLNFKNIGKGEIGIPWSFRRPSKMVSVSMLSLYNKIYLIL